MQVAIVTDSTSDIPDHLVRQHDIQIMPNIVVIEGQSLQDGRDISREEFYKLLPTLTQLPTTATASAGSYQELYEGIFRSGYEHILSIHPSVQLSGILNAVNTAAQAFENKVHVLDSGQISFGLGVQVLAAAEAASRGEPLESVIEIWKHTRERVRLFAMLDTMEYIRRSGRVSWAKASLGSLLQIKLFVEVKDGLVQRFGEVRTRRKGLARLIELGQSHKLERLAVLHTNAEEEAQKILENLDNGLPYPPLLINITTIIGTHVGPNALGLTLVPVSAPVAQPEGQNARGIDEVVK
jgi:DegV family protein with EDD domain